MKKDEFPWGKIIKTHEIGPYKVVEYIVGPAWEDSGKTQYHAEDCCFETLEQALIMVICSANGSNDHYYSILKLLGE